MVNKIARNRKSPKNESALISAYKRRYPSAKKSDGMDISAVVAKDGTRGHALMTEKINRSHDKQYHIAKRFVPDSKLKS